MKLVGRLIGLFIVGSIVWSLYWATQLSPQAQNARARSGRLAGDKCDPHRVVKIRVSVSKYPDNWRHIVDARAGRNTASDGTTIVNNGLKWPTVLTKNDVGEKERRLAGERLAGLTQTRPGMARDEYPPAEGRSSNAADYRYVPLRENSAQGASMGGQLRPWCNGQRYKLVAAP